MEHWNIGMVGKETEMNYANKSNECQKCENDEHT